MNKMAKEIIEQVKNIAAQLSNPDLMDRECFPDTDGEPNAIDYLCDALDIEYIIGSDGTYRGARVLVAFGGPNIWVDTKKGVVEGHWWNDSHTESFNDELDLDSALEELYNCR